MKEFLEERNLKPKLQTQQSGTDKMVDLYKSLEDASHNIADKLSRSGTPSGERSATPSGKRGSRRSRSVDTRSITTIAPSHSASNVGCHREGERRRRSSSKSHHRGRSSSAKPLPTTSTPVPAQRKVAPRKPMRQSTTTTNMTVTDAETMRSSSIASSSSRGFVAPSTASSSANKPQPPTCPIIEKVMGEGSIFLRWLPPRMDLMSRSNNVPVIGYEISINGLRRAQVSGAYTNQAVVGNLKLEKNTSVEIRTVSSTGMVSDAVHVDLMRSNVASQISSSSSSSKSSIKKNNTKATVLYDYNPQEDSPYTHQEQEIKLKQGQVVRVLSQERHDGFCRVKINKVHGWAPAAFLMMEPNSTAHR